MLAKVIQHWIIVLAELCPQQLQLAQVQRQDDLLVRLVVLLCQAPHNFQHHIGLVCVLLARLRTLILAVGNVSGGELGVRAVHEDNAVLNAASVGAEPFHGPGRLW